MFWTTLWLIATSGIYRLLEYAIRYSSNKKLDLHSPTLFIFRNSYSMVNQIYILCSQFCFFSCHQHLSYLVSVKLNYVYQLAVSENCGKTEDHHLTGISLSDTNKRYTVGKVSPNALQTCTHFRSSYSVTRVIRQKVSNLAHNRKRTFRCREYLLTRPH